MKKVALFAIFGLMALAGNATEPIGSVVTTTCGKKMSTVPSNYFTDPKEYEEYMKELNEALCNKKEMPKDIEDRVK